MDYEVARRIYTPERGETQQGSKIKLYHYPYNESKGEPTFIINSRGVNPCTQEVSFWRSVFDREQQLPSDWHIEKTNSTGTFVVHPGQTIYIYECMGRASIIIS